MQQNIINQLKLIVDEIIKESDVSDINYKIRLQENKDKEHGDYASNIAMILAKDLSDSPKNLAEQRSKKFPLYELLNNDFLNKFHYLIVN